MTTPPFEPTAEIRDAMAASHDLRGRIQGLYERTQYEDLGHALIGLNIVLHALEEVSEHRGLGGAIERQPDPEAHASTRTWLGDVKRIHGEATVLLETHSNEDLETALQALTVAMGSLEEVAERYE